jgi:hypothetical protein
MLQASQSGTVKRRQYPRKLTCTPHAKTTASPLVPTTRAAQKTLSYTMPFCFTESMKSAFALLAILCIRGLLEKSEKYTDSVSTS